VIVSFHACTEDKQGVRSKCVLELVPWVVLGQRVGAAIKGS
jgi:hypothetical protein